MEDRLLVAAVQMNSGLDKEANLATAVRLVESAQEQGAQLVALPEMFNCLGHFPDVIAAAESIPGPTSQAMSALAKRLGITLLAGSFCEQSEQPGKGYNTSLLFLPDGQIATRYRKIHLFDIDLSSSTDESSSSDRVSVTESNFMLPGTKTTTIKTPQAHLGLSICYDLRFPELYRQLVDEGAEVILVPAAFTQVTGRDHWELLLRARAVENQVYIIAPNQCGSHGEDLVTYGHSMIIDPWGQVLAQAGDEATVILAEIDRTRLDKVRSQLPALRHRRLE